MQKKYFKYIICVLVLIVSLLIFNDNVNASIKKVDISNNFVIGAVSDDLSNEEFDVCKSSGIVKTFQIIGYCLYILKIVIPLLLIVLGIIDFTKAMIASDPNEIKNAFSMLIKRVLAGIIVFFIPTIVGFVFSLVDNSGTQDSFECLTNCIKANKSCTIPNDGGVFSK